MSTAGHRGITVVQGSIETIHPADRAADVDGRRFEADALVVALGAERDAGRVPGFREFAIDAYDPDATARGREAVDRAGLGHLPGPAGRRAAVGRRLRHRGRQPGAGPLRGALNRRFAVPAADPEPAWRPLPTDVGLDQVCCLKYRRVVARDDTVRAGATILQLPARSGARSYAGRRVELQLRLDGRLVVWDGQRTVLVRPAPADAVQLRALHHARAELGTSAPSVGSAAVPAATHPWRRVQPGTKLYERIEKGRLSGSRTS